MKKILISLINDTINFKYKIDKTKEEKDLTKTLMNTNVICNDELIFSDNYLKNNSKIMTSFLNELIKEKKINKLVIEEFDIVNIVLNITNDIKSITKLYISCDNTINYTIYEKLLESKYLKYINCFEIPSFMLEKLCNNDVIVDLRCEIISISNFVYQNNLINYTKLYYRKTLKIFTKMTKEDLEDFETFCQINRNLKTIYIYDIDIKSIENIYNIIEKTNKKNIKILLHQNLDNTKIINDNIKELKIINKKLIKNCNSKIQITYGIDYIRKNFFKQLSITNIKTCLLIIIALELIVFISVKINNHKTKQNIEEISEIQNDMSEYFNDTDIEKDTLDETQNNETQNEETNNEPIITAYNTKYEQSFEKLNNINNDTKAWLTLNNTSINYPVVQTSDNDFYLKHDFNKDANANGWIFIDYRNNMEQLDQNTIIYGHNVQGTSMFATLKYTLREWWYNNKENLNITFNTPTKQMKAEIFSVYVIDNTNDYLYINFNDQDYTNFINMIKGRSFKDFGIEFTTNDKMITLSTCTDKGDKRLVVHAKIIQN
ncbi:MAG: class B sortase [Bacilli bacterium]|nr:class B sortase [Bacilli bacterium]